VKQLAMFKKPKTEFGGSLVSKGRRKTERPLDRNRPMHFVLKSNKAILLIRNQRSLRKILSKQAGTFGIKIYSETVQKDRNFLSSSASLLFSSVQSESPRRAFRPSLLRILCCPKTKRCE
jgi:hypothetical protein